MPSAETTDGSNTAADAAGRAAIPAAAGGTVAVLTAAAAWGSTGTAAHFAPGGTSAASVGAARIAVGGALLLIVAVSTAGRRQAVARLLAGGHDRVWLGRAVLLLAAAAVAGYQVCFFTAVRATGVAIGTVVAIGSAPVFTGLLTLLSGAARPGPRWGLATAAAVAGCAVLVTGGRASGASPAGVLLALLAGLCYAVYAVAAARLIARGGAETAVMGLLFGGAAVLLAPVLATGPDGWLLSARGIAVVGYLGAVTTVVAYLLYGRGLRTLSAPVAVTLGLAEPAVAAVLGLIVLHERLGARAVAGLVLVGLAIASLTAGGPGRRRAVSPSG